MDQESATTSPTRLAYPRKQTNEKRRDIREEVMSASASLEIRSFIDGRQMSARQWMLTALCFFIVLTDGIDVAIMGFVAPSIIDEWGISRPAFGLVMGAAPVGLAVGAIFAGSSAPSPPARQQAGGRSPRRNEGPLLLDQSGNTTLPTSVVDCTATNRWRT